MLKSSSNSATVSISNSPTLGIVGCGNIGGQQAANFLAHGYSVCVYDINHESMAQLQSLGATVTQSRAELAACSEIIFTALPTPSDVITAVLEGEQNLIQGLRPGSIYVDISTNSPETVLKLHQAMKQRGIEMLDAPLNDCSIGAQTQQGMSLALLTSGSWETFKRVEFLLQLMADHVLYCGEISCGTQCKLIHNAVNAITVQAVSEGITLGLASGIELKTIWDTLRLSSFGQNPGDIHGLPHYWFSRRFDDRSQHPAFTVKLLHKDLRLALDLAGQRNIDVPHVSLTIKDYEEAEKRQWSDYAATKVRCLQEERSRVVAQASLPAISSSTQHQNQSQSILIKDFATSKARFSWSSLLILVLVSNLFQFGLHWLFQHYF